MFSHHEIQHNFFVASHIFILDSEITDLHKVAIVHKVDRKKAKKTRYLHKEKPMI